MTVLVIFLLLIVCGLLGYLLRESGESQSVVPPNPEATTKAALELHRIRTRLNGSLAKAEIRSQATQTKRDIADALGRPSGDE